MPTIYKVLGQSAPNANTTANVYTVPASTNTVVSTIVITNRNAGQNTTYRIAVQPAGAALANQHFIAYDAAITALDSVALTMGITLGAADVVSANAGAANLSFSIFGTEIT